MFKQFFFLALLALSFGKVEAQTDSIRTIRIVSPTEKEAAIFEVVEEMPCFPGCNETDAQARKYCSDQKIMNWVYTQVKYPEQAKEYSAQGTVVVAFVVQEDGSMSNIGLDRRILPNFDPAIHSAEEIEARTKAANSINEEALRVVNLIAALPEKWIPGKQGGKAVKVRYRLPIRFKMK